MVDDGAGRVPLDAARLVAAPWPVEVLEEAGSTNALLAARARDGAGPQVLVTEHQTAGRGRLDRTWETPARAALTFSVLLRPEAPDARWPWLPLLTGYAVRAALPALPGGVSLTWPNDVLVGDLKVAGILVERVEGAPGTIGTAGAAAVVGIGLNVSTTADELPVPTATSLALGGAGREDTDRTTLLLAILAELHAGLVRWADEGDAWLRSAYRPVCATLGRSVRVELPAGAPLEGTATDLDASGRLVVDTAAGPVAVGAGDVIHVRSPQK